MKALKKLYNSRVIFLLAAISFFVGLRPALVRAEVTLVAPATYIKTTLGVGSQYYVDRTFTNTSLPSGFDTYTAISTKNDDKKSTATDLIVLNLSQSATIYVAYSAKVTKEPGWMAGFTDTGGVINVTDAQTYKVYQKDFAAGEVVFGGNLCCGAKCSDPINYFVFIDDGAAVEELAVDPAVLNLAPSDTATVTIIGGQSPYAVSLNSDPSVATASITDSTMTVNALAAGTTLITVTDSASTPIIVTVTVSSELAVDPTTMTLVVGEDETAAISGGVSPYSVSSAATGVATATLNPDGVSLTVSGVAAGSTTVTVSDSDSTPDSKDISITVVTALSTSTGVLNLDATDTAAVTISGGTTPYTVSSGNPSVATASLSGDTVTITAVSAGSILVTVSDASGQMKTVTVNVGGVAFNGLGECPLPPSVGGLSASPNVLIILDHSGSMVGGGEDNWTPAKGVVKAIIDEFPDLRFGLMRMDGSDYDGNSRFFYYDFDMVVRQGGKLLKPCGTDGDEIKAYLDNWPDADDPQTYTNLAETLLSAGQYFATVIESGNRVSKGPAGMGYYEKNYHYHYPHGTSNPVYDATVTDDMGVLIDTTSPIHYTCQNSYIIFITDGTATMDNDWNLVTDFIGDYDGDNEWGDCAHDVCCTGLSAPEYTECMNAILDANRGYYFDDVAKYLFENDMRSDLTGMQNLRTYVVGFKINHPLLSKAAQQGGAEIYFTPAISPHC